MRRVLVPMIAATVLSLCAAAPAGATNFVVNTVNDPGTGTCDAAECTFREAVTAANTGGVRDDTITFTVSGFISALSPFPGVQSAATQGKLTITGPGANTLALRRSTGNFGVLTTLPGSDTIIEGLTITGGDTNAGAGGGIYNNGTLVLDRVAIVDNNSNGGGGLTNNTGASLTVRRSLITDNTANPSYQGAGIYSLGTLVIDRSTITDNRMLGTSSFDFAPGILAAGPTTSITGSTIARNAGPNSAANIYANAGIVTLDNTIVADPIQIPSGTAANCGGAVAIVSAGYNLSDDSSCGLTGTGDKPGVEPQLGPLADNGGPTKTLAVPLTSPAIDAGKVLAAATDDQRGLPRPSDFPAITNVADGTDIGAFELQAPAPPPDGGGGGGTTTATCAGRDATVVGTDGRDKLVGTDGDDVIAALGGKDVVNGGGGNDLVCGGAGNDTIKGESGRDQLRGEAGKDKLSGGGGADTLVGGAAKDRCRGGGGKDKQRSC